jgi:hypothetical protein
MAQNRCSLDAVFIKIGLAIAAIAAAMAVVIGWLNVPGLIAGIVLLGTAAYLLAAIQSGIRAYAKCRGPSSRCSLNTISNVFAVGGVAFALVLFAVALALQFTALGFLFSWFLSWLHWAPAAAAEAAKNAALVSLSVAIASLVALVPALLSYRSCRDSEAPADTATQPIPPIG